MAVYKFSNAGGFGNITRYNDFLAGNPAVIQDAGAYFPLGEFTLASAQTEINFTNIPQTYTHLQIRGIWSRVSSDQYANIRFNGDTGSNYAWHSVYGAGSGGGVAEAVANATGIALAYSSSGTAFTGFVYDILDYRNTNKNKTVRGIEGRDTNGGGAIALHSGVWLNSSTAITSIRIYTGSNQIATFSHFALYGVLA